MFYLSPRTTAPLPHKKHSMFALPTIKKVLTSNINAFTQPPNEDTSS